MLNERKLSENEIEARDIALQGLKKNKRALVRKYGADAEKVMYGIAIKQAKKKVEEMNKNNLKELIKKVLQNPILKEDETRSEVMIWDEIGSHFEELTLKLKELGDNTTNVSWQKAITSISTQLDFIEEKIGKYDTKLGVISFTEEVNEDDEYQKDIEVQADEDEEYQKLKKDDEEDIIPFFDLKNWWEAEPSQIMSAVYHSKSQIPPTDKKKYDEQWGLLKKQLQKKYPEPIKEDEYSDRKQYLNLLDQYKRANVYTKPKLKKALNQAAKKVGITLSLDEMVDKLSKSHLSPEEYQKSKKLKGFDSKNYKWNKDKDLYDKIEEDGFSNLGKENSPSYPKRFRSDSYIQHNGQNIIPGVYVFNKEYKGKGLYQNPHKKLVVALSHEDLEQLQDDIYIMSEGKKEDLEREKLDKEFHDRVKTLKSQPIPLYKMFDKDLDKKF